MKVDTLYTTLWPSGIMNLAKELLLALLLCGVDGRFSHVKGQKYDPPPLLFLGITTSCKGVDINTSIKRSTGRALLLRISSDYLQIARCFVK